MQWPDDYVMTHEAQWYLSHPKGTFDGSVMNPGAIAIVAGVSEEAFIVGTYLHRPHQVARIEADSKLFRSLLVVLAILLATVLWQ